MGAPRMVTGVVDVRDLALVHYKAGTRKFIRNNVDVPWKIDNSKIKKNLGLNSVPYVRPWKMHFKP